MSSALVRGSMLLAAAVLLATGCGPVMSLHPLYQEQNLVTIPDLTGRWIRTGEDEKRVRWTFQRSDGSLYKLTIDSPDDSESPWFLKAGLVHLGDYLFLDITADTNDPVLQRHASLVVPVHIIFRIWVERNAFLIRFLDSDWFSREVHAGHIDVAYVRIDEDSFLLSAPTRDLQRFALQYATDGEAFPRASGSTYVIESP